MKKLSALTTIFMMILAACEQPMDNSNPGQTTKVPTFTIKNESLFVLTNVTYANVPFSTELAPGAHVTKELTSGSENFIGSIQFTRKDIGIICKTRLVPVSDGSFTFTNNSVVDEVGNPNNTEKTLKDITFQSQLSLEYGSLKVAKNETLNFGEIIINNSKSVDFVLKNPGVGKLLLTGGTEPVKITSTEAGVFSVVQPIGSELAAKGSLPFKINFAPKSTQTYTATVTISSNDQNGDFTFYISAVGTPRKPIAVVIYDNNQILQNEPIDSGEVLLTQSKSIMVIIKNDGTETLTIEKANIAITGTDRNAFIKSTDPGENVAPGFQTSFFIEYKPVKEGINQAVLTIPTNDNSRNPIIVNLQVTGKKGTPVLELTQETTIISNNTLTPVDFDKVEIGTSQTLTFTIKNTGNVALELIGDFAVESTNPVFAVSSQPANRTINQGETEFFLIRYTPTTEGEVTGNITIANNAGTGQFVFPIKGTGYEKKPQITIQQGTSVITPHSEYDFGSTTSGKTKDIVFTIKNTGLDANLLFITENDNRINLVDNQSGFFTVTHQPSSTTVVTPGNTTTFTVHFSPTTTGLNFNATVRIKTNSRENDDFSFRVKGTARAANTETRLSGLEFSTGTLNPQFNSGIYTYELRLQEGPTLINVKPTSMDTNITNINVNGVSQASGILSQDIILSSASTVTLIITAEDGTTTAVYTVNLKIVKTWEKLYGVSGRRYGIYRAINNGEGGIYAGGYTSNNTAAFFNIDKDGNFSNPFNFSSYGDSSYSTLGPLGMGAAYNDYFAVYESSIDGDYYITKTTNPSIRPSTISTSLVINSKKQYLYPKGIAKNNNGYYFVAGNTHYYATASASNTTYGIFINRHYSDGSWELGNVIPLTIAGITANSYEVYGMTILTNGDVLIYGSAEKSGNQVAYAAAVNVSASNAGSWAVRWSNIYEITNKLTRFTNCFWDISSNIVLLGDTDNDGLVVKFPGNVTTAAAAKPAGWPKVITGTNAGFFAGLACIDGSGYIFVGLGSGTGSHGGSDIWTVKTDTNVIKTWEKFFGGTGEDYADAIVEQPDGFIIAGSTTSPIIAGQAKKGTEDIYILKINKDGTMD